MGDVWAADPGDGTARTKIAKNGVRPNFRRRAANGNWGLTPFLAGRRKPTPAYGLHRRLCRCARHPAARRHELRGGITMSFILWIIVGGLLGWIASMIMKTNDQQGIFLNIIVGIVGAFLGGLLIAPLVGTGTINRGDFSFGSLMVSLLG